MVSFSERQMCVTQYPVRLEKDSNGTILVTFYDIPEAITHGVDEADALTHAVDALETALMIYMADRRPIPTPSPRPKRKTVALPLLAEAKVALYQSMIATRMRKSDLARKLGVHAPQVDRLLDLKHSSKIEHLDAALHAVGKKLTIEVIGAAA